MTSAGGDCAFTWRIGVKLSSTQKRTPVRRDHEIVIFDDQIVNRCDRQIQLQRLPMRTVIERNEDAEFGSGVEQPFTFGIFAHRMHVGAIGNSVHDRAPGLSQIARLENVWLEVVEFMPIHRHISGVRRRAETVRSDRPCSTPAFSV